MIKMNDKMFKVIDTIKMICKHSESCDNCVFCHKKFCMFIFSPEEWDSYFITEKLRTYLD